ncbi:FAD-binding protein [Methylobacterium sp. A54F]
MGAYEPQDEAGAAEIVRGAAGRAERLRLVGSDTKAGIGRPAQDKATLSAAGLTGITLYEPAEMVIAARAGTPLFEVEAALAASGQMLPFEPVDHRALMGTTGEPTFGAVAAANNSGPRRINMGAARDSLIGVRFVNGRGEVIKSGGRVMKNVTGLDLVKLMAGSWGTLGFLTEVTFKVLPVQERATTLMFRDLDDTRAIEALSAALGSPFELTGAAHLPAGLGSPEARTLMRLEGFTDSVAYRFGELRQLLRRFGAPEAVEGEASADLWRGVRDVAPFAGSTEAVWRISTAPTRGAEVTHAIGRALAARWYYDWGGGLIWLATDAGGDAGASVIRSALGAGGHATLVRAPDAVRAAVPVFQPLAEPLMRVTQGIKAAHDPGGLFNPGRMYAGV